MYVCILCIRGPGEPDYYTFVFMLTVKGGTRNFLFFFALNQLFIFSFFFNFYIFFISAHEMEKL